MPKKISLPFLVCLLAMATAFSGPVIAQQVTLKLHSFLPPPSNPVKTFLKPWIEKVTKESNGTLKVCGTNISFYSIKGQFAKDLAKENDQASVDFILNYLRSAYGSNVDKYFIKAHVTDWGSNPYTIGAYSGAIPGKAKLRKVLKKSDKNKIFFAGEATSGAHGCVHGADRSGKRVVKELLKKVKI